MKSTFLYAYYLPKLDAVKVGFGFNPRARMLSYTKQYQVVPDYASLIQWSIPSPGLAANIEAECHTLLLGMGFKRIKVASEDLEANEIFSLEGHAYSEAVELIAEFLDETFENLIKGIPKQSFKRAARAESRKEAIANQRKEVFREKILQAEEFLLAGFESHYSDFKRTMLLARKHMEGHQSKRSLSGFRSLWGNKQPEEPSWLDCEKCAENTEKILLSARTAKKFYVEAAIRFELDVLRAAQKSTGLDLWNIRIGEHLCNPPLVYHDSQKKFLNGGDISIDEVIKCACLATGLGGGEDAYMNFVLNHSKLRNLIGWVSINRPPELSSEYTQRPIRSFQ